MTIIGVGIAVAGAGIASYGAYRWLTTRPPPPPPPPTKVETRMVVTEVPPSSIYPGQECMFGGYLEDVEGNRLSGKTIELYADDKVIASGITDIIGRWSWSVALDESTVLYAAFPGDEEYIGCSRR